VRIRTLEELMVSMHSAAADVTRLRVMVKDLKGKIDFITPTVSLRQEGGEERLLPPAEAEHIGVYHLLEFDPLALRPNDPLVSPVRVGLFGRERLAVGLFPHSADPFWHGLRLLMLMQEILGQRKLDLLMGDRAPHQKRAAYQVSRVALDVLDAHFKGSIRAKARELRREGLITGVQLANRMRAFMDHAIGTASDFIRPASEEETVARALTTGQAIPALLDPEPPNAYN